MDIQIEQFTPRDKKELVKLINAFQDHLVSIDTTGRYYRPAGYGEKFYRNMLKELRACTGKIFVARYSNHLIGYVAGGIYIIPTAEALGRKKNTKSGMMMDLLVLPAYRKEGVGSLLLKKMEAYLRKLGCRAIVLEVYAPNTNAVTFYKKKGFHTDLLILRKQLRRTPA